MTRSRRQVLKLLSRPSAPQGSLLHGLMESGFECACGVSSKGHQPADAPQAQLSEWLPGRAV